LGYENSGGLLQQIFQCLDHCGGVIAVDQVVIETRWQVHIASSFMGLEKAKKKVLFTGYLRVNQLI